MTEPKRIHWLTEAERLAARRRDEKEKRYQAIVAAVKRAHATGSPLSVGQVASRFGISTSTAANLIKDRGLRKYLIGGTT